MTKAKKKTKKRVTSDDFAYHTNNLKKVRSKVEPETQPVLDGITLIGDMVTSSLYAYERVVEAIGTWKKK